MGGGAVAARPDVPRQRRAHQARLDAAESVVDRAPQPDPGRRWRIRRARCRAPAQAGEDRFRLERPDQHGARRVHVCPDRRAAGHQGVAPGDLGQSRPRAGARAGRLPHGFRGSHTQCPSIIDLDMIFFRFSDCSLFTVAPWFQVSVFRCQVSGVRKARTISRRKRVTSFILP